MKKALEAAGAKLKVVAVHGGEVTGKGGKSVPVDHALRTVASVLFDAVYIPGGDKSVATLLGEPKVIAFVEEAYKHCKAVAASGEGLQLLTACRFNPPLEMSEEAGEVELPTPGVIVGKDSQSSRIAKEFIAAIAQHRTWDRENPKAT